MGKTSIDFYCQTLQMGFTEKRAFQSESLDKLGKITGKNWEKQSFYPVTHKIGLIFMLHHWIIFLKSVICTIPSNFFIVRSLSLDCPSHRKMSSANWRFGKSGEEVIAQTALYPLTVGGYPHSVQSRPNYAKPHGRYLQVGGETVRAWTATEEKVETDV
ncbi:MAG: hypothetical protein LBE56_00355 [Tannerella sp.]|jgi:hypothetical protein|nr:hypothetical protein [Tannerella sp.]